LKFPGDIGPVAYVNLYFLKSVFQLNSGFALHAGVTRVTQKSSIRYGLASSRKIMKISEWISWVII